MSVVVPKGVVSVPFTLTDVDPNITLSDTTTADVWEEFAKYKCPKKSSVAFRKGDKFYVYIADGTGAQITTGLIRVVIKDPNEKTEFEVIAPTDPDALDTLNDERLSYKLKAGFFRTEDQILSLQHKGTTAIAKANTKIALEGVINYEL